MSRTKRKSKVHDECVDEFRHQMEKRGVNNSLFEGNTDDKSIKQPDILLPDYKTLVEIKTLQPEPGDDKALKDIEEQIKKDGIAGYSHPDYYERFLRLLNKARKQFRPYKDYRSITVVYDTFDFFLRQDPQILMEGLQKIVVRTPHDSRIKSYVDRMEYDHQPFRPDKNTEIGAIAFRKRKGDGFQVYINSFADKSRLPDEAIFIEQDNVVKWPRKY